MPNRSLKSAEKLAKSKLGLPPSYRGKPIGTMTVGWQLGLTTQASGTFSINVNDVMFSVACADQNYSAATATMSSAFAGVRIRKFEVWEKNGLPTSLTFAASDIAGIFSSGPDKTVTDDGSSAYPSHCKLVVKPGSMLDKWFAAASTTNLAIVAVNNSNPSGSSIKSILLVIRVTFDYVLNDASAFAATYTTTSVNTVTGGLIYWLNPSFSSNQAFSELYPGTATYNA